LDGGKAKCFQADFLSTNELSLGQEFIETFGGIDILINNAGDIFYVSRTFLSWANPLGPKLTD
jgi:short-subunit dehydrogenase